MQARTPARPRLVDACPSTVAGPSSQRWATPASLLHATSGSSLPRPAQPLATPSSARSKGKRRAHPWDDDDDDSDSFPSRRQRRRCERSTSTTTPAGWASQMTGTSPLGSAPAFGLVSTRSHPSLLASVAEHARADLRARRRPDPQRPLSSLPTRSRPAPLNLPTPPPSRPGALFRRSTSDPPPSSPTTFHSRHDRSFDALNDTLCRAQSLFVQGFADAQHLPPGARLPADAAFDDDCSDPMSSSPSELSPDLLSTPMAARRLGPCDIPSSSSPIGPDAVPELCVSSSETSTASWFDGPRFADPADGDSDEDEIVMDTRRHSVDDLCVPASLVNVAPSRC